jgi:predicted amidohydrolase YtcJ
MKAIARVLLLTTWVSLESSAQASPDLILVNGRIFTAESATAYVEALAIRDGKIAARGFSTAVEAAAGKDTRRVDLHGHVVVPGFNDAHVHFWPTPAGVTLQFKTLEPSWQEVTEAVNAAVAGAQAGTWIFGTVGRTVILDETVTRAALDEIAPKHPVLLRAFYGHGYVSNSPAISLLGIAEAAPDPAGGRYERIGRSRRVNGRLWEYAGWNQDRVLVARIPDDDAIQALRVMANEAVSFGITSLQVFASMPVDRFVRLLVRADLPIRVRAMPIPPTTPAGRDTSELQHLGALQNLGPKVTVSGIKWILDGTPIEHGAAMRKPYADRPDLRGALSFPENEIAAMIGESLALKQPILLHCAGDRAAEAVFDALDKSAGMDWKSQRVRIEHGDGVYGELITRARALGVIVVQNPSHFDRSLVGDRFATDTSFFPLRSLLEARIPIAIGSDGPLNPFLNIMLAVIHPMRPTEALTREQAVQAYTSGSAFAEFAEADKGTLSVGKRADLAVLSGDLFAMPVQQLPPLRSVLTLLGGEIVYDAHVLDHSGPPQ